MILQTVCYLTPLTEVHFHQIKTASFASHCKTNHHKFNTLPWIHHHDAHWLIQEEDEVGGFTGRKKTKEQRKKNKEAKKKDKKKNKKEKKKKNKKNKDKEVSEEDEDDYDEDEDDIFGDDYDEDYDEEEYDDEDEDDEEEVEEVEDCEVFKCNAVTNGYTAYKLYRSINDIRQKLDLWAIVSLDEGVTKTF